MRYFASSALLPEAWAKNVLIDVDHQGNIAAVTAGQDCPADAQRLAGPVVPGMPNLHSHAFQRAMAGLAEYRGHPQDSFWTWRDLMYRHAARLTPDTMQAVAAWLYIEMLKAGYTSVAEFHYLHHAPGGARYADPAEMSHRLIAAADSAGIGITLLPVLYSYSGFGAQPAQPSQARFLHDLDGYAALMAGLHARYRDAPAVRMGMAFHSLRAVSPAQLAAGCAMLDALDPGAPIHIHIAEQTAEVQACLDWCGSRPVAWLYDHAQVDARWCLVHATHVDATEVKLIAASGAVAGICPTTEANLGDGFFPAREYLDAPGCAAFGVGSDSHVTVDASEELRLFEYGQRLLHRQRCVLADPVHTFVGRNLFQRAASGGAQALAQPVGRLEPGRRADLVVLDNAHPFLAERQGDAVLDGWIFVAGRECVRDVMVQGRWRIRDRRHPGEGVARAAFLRAAQALIAP